MEKIQYELMRPQEIVAARAKSPIAYVPIGPLEWHSLHSRPSGARQAMGGWLWVRSGALVLRISA